MIKARMEDLAILGAAPAFSEKLHVGRPNIGNRERLLERVNDILDRRWFTNSGPYLQQFEREIEARLGVRHCIAMCNATVALEIASRALGLRGEVIVPSFTFVATAHVLQWLEITPVFCDIDPATHNLDPHRVEQMITARTSGILGVHVWGRPCPVDALAEIAERHGLKLMYDAAHAFGSSYKGKMIGHFGALEVFSFHATKFLNTFEGGAVVTNDDELANKIRLMTNFGFRAYDDVISLGMNGKMNEISAAMGLTGLESWDDLIATNYRHYKSYQRLLAQVPGLKMIRYDESEENNYQYIVLEVDQAATRIGRDQIVQVLHAENVLARRYFHPGCHRMEPYRSYYPNAGLMLPETELLTQRVLCLPTGSAVQDIDIENLCELIGFIIAHGEEISRQIHP